VPFWDKCFFNNRSEFHYYVVFQAGLLPHIWIAQLRTEKKENTSVGGGTSNLTGSVNYCANLMIHVKA